MLILIMINVLEASSCDISTLHTNLNISNIAGASLCSGFTTDTNLIMSNMVKPLSCGGFISHAHLTMMNSLEEFSAWADLTWNATLIRSNVVGASPRDDLI